GLVFMAEINDFVADLNNKESDLFGTAIYLEDQRRKLISNGIPEDDKLPGLLDEYLTALVFWLRSISFIANYSLVSIKDISLDYRLGTSKNFVHLFGEWMESMVIVVPPTETTNPNRSLTHSLIAKAYYCSKRVM
ncbi:MAG: hypothetical protein IPF70_06895, partial [Saprospiraceae bacterium]|nr:hypothetical protein [Saprospiraceae bacterium]